MLIADSPIHAPRSSRTFCPRDRRRYVLWSAILASAMGFIDGSVVSIAVPAIRADLPATLGEALWISNGYLLFLSSLILIGGALGDSYGLRRVFLGGIVLFVAASLACALAPTPLLLVLARSLQGIGAAIMVPGSLAIIAKAYPADERGKAIGIWASASALTTTAGPILGGYLLSAGGDSAWRLIFAINLPLGLAAIAMLWLMVPPDAAQGRRHVDWVGGLLITASLFLFAYGLTGKGGEGSVPESARLVLYIVAGAAVLAAFVWSQARIAHPMVPLRLFSNIRFSGANLLTFTLYFGLSAIMFYLPMAVIGGWGIGEAKVALALTPFGASIALLSGPAGKLSDRYGPAPLIATGSLIVAAAFAGLAASISYQNLWLNVLPLMVLAGVGMSLVVSPLSSAVMTSVDDDDTGTASGVNNAVSRVAGLFAVALMGIVASAVYGHFIGPDAVTGAGEALSYGERFAGPADLARRHAVATDRAFSAVAGTVSAMSVLSAAVAWFTLRATKPSR